MLCKKMFIREQKELGYSENEVRECRMPIYPFFKTKFLVGATAHIIMCTGLITSLISTIMIICNIGKEPVLFTSMLTIALMFFTIYWIVNYKKMVCFYGSIIFHRKIRRGLALTKEDFEQIESASPVLYDAIFSLDCMGHCYATCFEILKCLKKGKIFFVALPLSECEQEKLETDCSYTSHMLYEKNGWVFDTYSCLQWKKEEFRKHYQALDFRDFNYEDIKNLSCVLFGKEVGLSFKDYCQKNNIHEDF